MIPCDLKMQWVTFHSHSHSIQVFSYDPCKTSIRFSANFFSFWCLFFISVFRGKKFRECIWQKRFIWIQTKVHTIFFEKQIHFFSLHKTIQLWIVIKARALEYGKVYSERLYHQILVTMEPLKICKKYQISLLIGLSFRL